MTSRTSLLMSARLLLGALSLATLSVVLGGCVGQEDYDNVHDLADSAQNRRNQAIKDLDSAKDRIRDLEAQAGRDAAARAELERQNAALLKALNDAGLTLADLQNSINSIHAMALDPETDRLLKELVAQYPDLLTYDAAKGMVRFNSDLTFNSGDDTVRPDARQSLAAFANVLQNPVAARYDVIIVGHTDTQPIGRSAARHPTNVHLSAHRAISVRRALAEQGADGARMQVAGWGEFRPAVPNNANGNTPQNRRVEVYLTAHREEADAGAAAKAGTPATPAAHDATPTRTNGPTRPADIVK